MNLFHASQFFDLSQYSHTPLFDDCQYVWEAILKIDTYLKNYALGKIEAIIPEGAFLVKPELISIGEGTVVEPGVYIRGPCVIGKNCTIRHGAYLRGGVVVGDNCVIGHTTEVKQSIFLNNTNAAHFAFLGETILGNQVNLGAGTKCANLKLDHQEIVIRHEGHLFRTGMKKLGAIIGDYSQLGCNAVTNPGAILGKNVFSYPSLNFGGVVPANSIIKNDVKIKIQQKKAHP
jgi:UDP-N-acetylglucosamine diphosphorylase / glucose-1-phosphate thymidylyltransferase / UDP-N-acetylgalactosamine diphosphorylase / glucosamine-1-phosphate N-acetyltransferase / galactosamine-1-phosphate N-acetyltransferase